MASQDLYSDSYFLSRNMNDARRLRSFQLEKEFLEKHRSFGGSVCDVGCSTGEFLEAIKWPGTRFGIEPNERASAMAESRHVQVVSNLAEINVPLDCVILRGTLQHVPDPFLLMKEAHSRLKPGGHLAILATPNSGGLAYRIFQDLPALDPPRNYWTPSVRQVKSVGENLGFLLEDWEAPYWSSPYRHWLDFPRFFAKLLFPARVEMHAFPGNMFNAILTKPNSTERSM